ncbi:hypothetical protein RUND412_007915 [Rhizina undulata]
MASGFGLNGGVSRVFHPSPFSPPPHCPTICFPFWQDFLACYVISTSSDSEDSKWKCLPQREDYYECLHHNKEIQKTKILQAAYNRQRKLNPPTERPEKEAGIKSLGLLDKGSKA